MSDMATNPELAVINPDLTVVKVIVVGGANVDYTTKMSLALSTA